MSHFFMKRKVNLTVNIPSIYKMIKILMIRKVDISWLVYANDGHEI